MRYIQPFGSTDIDGPYVNGNPAAGVSGSIPPAEMVEHPLRELTTLIRESTYQPTLASLQQLTYSVRTQLLNFAIDEGQQNSLVVSFSPPFDALAKGLPLHVLVAQSNTGPATILVDTIGPIYIIRSNGASLSPGDLSAGQVACLIYDGAFFQLQNYLGVFAGTLANHYYQVKIPYAADTSSVANSLNAPFDPALTALFPGLMVEVKVNNTNTGAVMLYPNSLPGRPIRLPSTMGFQELSAGQVTVGMVILVVYDGTQWQLLSSPAVKRAAVESTLQLVRRFVYQSPNQAQIYAPSDNPQIFTCNYTPVAGGNKLKVEVTGAIGYESTTCPRVCVYLAYKPAGAQQWIPTQFPGLDYPPDWPTQWKGSGAQEQLPTDFSATAIAALKANVAVLGFEYPMVTGDWGKVWPGQVETLPPIPITVASATFGSAHHMLRVWERFARNFVIQAHLPVPEGPPSSITFGLFFRPKEAEEEETLASLHQQVIHIAFGGAVLKVHEFTG
jgi:hypothetical protein